MFNREFIQSKLGKASVASIAAMTLFVALSTKTHFIIILAPFFFKVNFFIYDLRLLPYKGYGIIICPKCLAV